MQYCTKTNDGWIWLLLLGTLALGAGNVGGAAGLTQPAKAQSVSLSRTFPGVADIQFSGTSTLHDFAGKVSTQPFVLVLHSNSWSAKGEVLTTQMTTDNKGRDRKMWEMLGASTHPRIMAEVLSSPIPGPAGTNVTLVMRIKDRQQRLPARISHWTETADEITFQASWEVSLKEYGLKPPSVVGVVRVGDRVHLEAAVKARKSQPGVTAAAVRPTICIP